MIPARGGYTNLIPAFPFTGCVAQAVQHRRNLVVAVTYSHPADDLQSFHRSPRLSRRAGTVHLQLCMYSALPMNREKQNLPTVICSHNDLLNGCAKDHLPECRRAAIIVPDLGEVLAHCVDSCFLLRRQ